MHGMRGQACKQLPGMQARMRFVSRIRQQCEYSPQPVLRLALAWITWFNGASGDGVGEGSDLFLVALLLVMAGEHFTACNCIWYV